MNTTEQPLLRVTGLSRSYGTRMACADISFEYFAVLAQRGNAFLNSCTS